MQRINQPNGMYVGPLVGAEKLRDIRSQDISMF